MAPARAGRGKPKHATPTGGTKDPAQKKVRGGGKLPGRCALTTETDNPNHEELRSSKPSPGNARSQAGKREPDLRVPADRINMSGWAKPCRSNGAPIPLVSEIKRDAPGLLILRGSMTKSKPAASITGETASIWKRLRITITRPT